MKKMFILVTVVLVLLIGATWWSKTLQKNDMSIISNEGIHWHSNLEVYVNGKKIEIPANIGLEGGHRPIHTHIEDAPQGVIHMEFEGLVRKSDTKLGQFFTNWNQDMGSFGQNMKMKVNGIDNQEFKNYEMMDGDKIELRYE